MTHTCFIHILRPATYLCNSYFNCDNDDNDNDIDADNNYDINKWSK